MHRLGFKGAGLVSRWAQTHDIRNHLPVKEKTPVSHSKNTTAVAPIATVLGVSAVLGRRSTSCVRVLTFCDWGVSTFKSHALRAYDQSRESRQESTLIAGARAILLMSRRASYISHMRYTSFTSRRAPTAHPLCVSYVSRKRVNHSHLPASRSHLGCRRRHHGYACWGAVVVRLRHGCVFGVTTLGCGSQLR